MTNRDDMVLTPSITGGRGPSRGALTRSGRRLHGVKPRSGVFRRAAVTSAAARRARGIGVGKLLKRGGPVALALTLITVVAARLATGRNMQNLGALLNDKAWGEMDEKARATIQARMEILNDDQVARGVAQAGNVDHLRPTFDLFVEDNLRRERGRSIALQDKGITTDNKAEILALRARTILSDAFNAAGGQQALDNLARELSSHIR